MTANDPDGARDSGTGPAAGDAETEGWVPAPRHPDPPLPPPLEDLDVPPPGPYLDDSGWEQPSFRAPPPGPSLDLDGWDSPPVTPPAPAPPPWTDTSPSQVPQSGPPPGPAMNQGGWGPELAQPAPGGGPPPGPALNLDGWGPGQSGYGMPAGGGPPPGPDVSLAAWAPPPRPGPDNAAAGPWSGYREGWFRRLLARLRGGRPRS